MAKPLSKADLGKFTAFHDDPANTRIDISAPKTSAPAPANSFKPTTPGQKAGL